MNLLRITSNKTVAFLLSSVLLYSPVFVRAQSAGTLNNPITFPSIQGMIVAILNALVIISVPVIVFFLIYAGFMYVTAQGNPEKIKAASKALLYVVIGGVIIIGSMAIMTIVGDVVTQFSS